MSVTKADKVRGSVYGLAYGDAWGWPMEFMPYEEIESLRLGFPTSAIVTDDTQMSLYTMGAILDEYIIGLTDSPLKDFIENPTKKNSDEVRILFAGQFISWLGDQDNNRAPGITCINSLNTLVRFEEDNRRLITGLEGTSEWSKGCGVNMRSGWLGLLPYTAPQIARLSVLQASVTHNNPIALAASALTSLAVYGLYNARIGKGSLYDYVTDAVYELIEIEKGFVGEDNILGENYLKGLYELQDFLGNSWTSLEQAHLSDSQSDVCAILGEGKIAEEALLLAIFALDKYKEDAVEGLRRLAQTSGDSDSIAAIAGGFFGAAYGPSVFPEDWFAQIEPRYQDELNQTVEGLIALTEA
jgi:ADP-ribosylglycohydrolase